jgi:hypothetical protein
MKKFLVLFLIIILSKPGIYAQEAQANNAAYKRQPAIGISFALNDYQTAQRIRSRSFESVISNHELAKFNEMAPGLAVSYFKGLHNHIDFAGTIVGSFVDNPLPNRTATTTDLLTEVDASLNFKMFTDQYWFTPYISAGIGGSKFQNYYGAFLPLGGGFKVNLFDEASIFLNAQYRVPVTPETGNYHLFYNIGISGIIGKKKE